MNTSRACLRLAVATLAVIGVLEIPAWAADRVSGILTGTYMIVEDTDLIGDVTCNVPNNQPCFAFGASGVELRLNGFTVTGRGDPITGCGGPTGFGNEGGVHTNSQNRVGVRGPGLLHRFRGDGVLVNGSNDARVENLTISTNCLSGIRVTGTSFGTLVQGNVSVRNGSTSASCGGI